VYRKRPKMTIGDYIYFAIIGVMIFLGIALVMFVHSLWRIFNV